MKTRLTTFLSVCAAIAGAALLSGCSKGAVIELGGEAIRFAATSGGSAATKTAYGLDNTAKTMQALDWVDGDVITIASPQAVVQSGGTNPAHASNYVVAVTKTGTAADVESKGTVSNQGPNGLMWLDTTPEGGYNFFAIYPESGNGISLVPESGLVTATIPATQTLQTALSDKKTVGSGNDAISYTVYPPDMKYAFMTASKLAYTPPTDAVPSVDLRFIPAFTAVEFNVSSKDNAINLKNIGLYAASDNLAGDFTMTAGSLEGVSVASPSKSVTMSLGEGGVDITKAAGATFTLFMVPVQNSGVLTMKFTEDGVGTCTHALTYATAGTDIGATTTHEAGDPVKFIAGHKYRINMLKLPSNRWNFKLLDLTGEAIEWTDVDVEVENKDYPEATQFEVEGVNNGRYYTAADQTEKVPGRDAKAFRQYWLLDKDHPATVKFKVMSPVGFDWLVVPEGDVEYYTIESDVDAEGYTAGGLRGPILTVPGTAATTNVILYISAKDASDTAEHSLHFKTYVISKDDKIQYSLDTETQLYDFRGYHYFILNNSTIVN